MRSAAKAAGFAALIQAICYIFGFVMLATVMNPGDVDGWSQVRKLEFVLERGGLFQLWNIVIYVVFGVALVVLAAILHRLLAQPGSPSMSIATLVIVGDREEGQRRFRHAALEVKTQLTVFALRSKPTLP